MKRDCGPGGLIPVKFEVVSCTGMDDTENETNHTTLDAALQEFERRVQLVIDVICSNVRLYAKDKKGYANCVKSWALSAEGTVHESNRLTEL